MGTSSAGRDHVTSQEKSANVGPHSVAKILPDKSEPSRVPASIGGRAIRVQQSCNRERSVVLWVSGHTRVRHGTNCGAMRLIVEPFAFGTFVGVDHISEASDANRRIRTFQLASATAGAPRGDNLVRHNLISNVRIQRSVNAVAHPLIPRSGFAPIVEFHDPNASASLLQLISIKQFGMRETIVEARGPAQQ